MEKETNKALDWDVPAPKGNPTTQQGMVEEPASRLATCWMWVPLTQHDLGND